jgi:hypothetical protein
MTWLWVSVGAIVACFTIVTFSIKGFWKDFLKDLCAIFTRHWLKVIGRIIQFAVPIALVAIAYCTKYSKTGVKIPLIVWLIAIPLLLIWWGKMRKAVSEYLVRIKSVNEVIKGRHMAMIAITSFIRDLVMPFATAVALWFFVRLAGMVLDRAENALMVFALCIGVGGMLIFVDTSINAANMPNSLEINRDGNLSKKK